MAKKKSHYREVYNHYRKLGYSPERARRNAQGCYVATAVYGSYDCPEVWTLRSFRDYKLATNPYGRLFIKLYYATSPTIVKLFGNRQWFAKFFRGRLDKFVSRLQSQGVSSEKYEDMKNNYPIIDAETGDVISKKDYEKMVNTYLK